ncbi:hypothetical protein O2K51_10320 [Apibacter raozihei]|uniref:hypothetical protein n=1 Tax=Apibacter TaxID=1778601 RepID=UPI000FE2C3A9|nr:MULTISPECIES: hypothetical protein [Apibacter]
MEALVTKDNIKKLIPQREPVLLVDELLNYSEEDATSVFFIPQDHIFVNQAGYLEESGLIENMAQTTAMHMGYEFYKNGVPAPEGYIGSIRKLHVYALPLSGTSIKTHITKLNEILGVVIVSAEVIYNDKIIAQGEMRLVQSN